MKTNNFENNLHAKEEFPKERELKTRIEELEHQFEDMKKEIEELKLQLREKTDNQHIFIPEIKNTILNAQQTQDVNQFQIQNEDTESNQNFENIEGSKYMMKKICVMKKMMNQESSRENLECLTNELEIMKLLNHPSVLKAECETVINQNHEPSILVEYCPTNLEQVVKDESLSKVQQVFSIYQIASGMKYIHSRNVIHKNLKPASIQMTSKGTIKIGEFENSRIIKSEHPRNDEQIEKMSDVSSFGDIVYFILSGGKTTEIKNISSLSTLSLLAQQLIDACWSVELESRPSFEIICDVLEKNNFNLASLSQQETEEVSQKISQYKKQFSF